MTARVAARTSAAPDAAAAAAVRLHQGPTRWLTRRLELIGHVPSCSAAAWSRPLLLDAQREVEVFTVVVASVSLWQPLLLPPGAPLRTSCSSLRMALCNVATVGRQAGSIAQHDRMALTYLGGAATREARGAQGNAPARMALTTAARCRRPWKGMCLTSSSYMTMPMLHTSECVDGSAISLVPGAYPARRAARPCAASAANRTGRRRST